jgi:hypothetical protein
MCDGKYFRSILKIGGGVPIERKQGNATDHDLTVLILSEPKEFHKISGRRFSKGSRTRNRANEICVFS